MVIIGVSEQETFAKYVVKFISKQEKEYLNKLFATLEEKANAIEGSQENSEAKSKEELISQTKKVKEYFKL